MITLAIDAKKVITLALVPFVPTAEVIAMSAGVQGDYDKVKMLVQIQIMSYPEMNVIASALLTIDELKAFLHLGRAVGMSVDAIASVVDVKFEDYRKLVVERSSKP